VLSLACAKKKIKLKQRGKKKYNKEKKLKESAEFLFN